MMDGRVEDPPSEKYMVAFWARRGGTVAMEEHQIQPIRLGSC